MDKDENKPRSKTVGPNPRVYKTYNPNTELWDLIAYYLMRQNESQKEDELDE